MKTFAATALAVLAFAAPASALTHEEYVAQADQICLPANHAVKKKFRQIKPAYRHSRGQRRIQIMARFYAFYGRRLSSLTVQLRALPQPAADVQGLTAWLDGWESAGQLYVASRRAAKRHNFKGFIFTLIAASETEREANKMVLGYGFRRCTPPGQEPQL